MKRSKMVSQNYSNKHELHDFAKQNLFTPKDNNGLYDVFKCSKCGVYGKRYTLDGDIIRDRQYKAKVYEYCDTAKNHINKKKLHSRG